MISLLLRRQSVCGEGLQKDQCGFLLEPGEPPPLPGSGSEVEGVALPGPDLPDLVSDTQLYRPVQAVDLGIDPQTAVLEGNLDQQPSEARGEGQTAQRVHGLG